MENKYTLTVEEIIPLNKEELARMETQRSKYLSGQPGEYPENDYKRKRLSNITLNEPEFQAVKKALVEVM